jgi:hypothetical protein
MGDIQSLACGLVLFHIMKTTYIYDKPENRNSWIVDFTIYSVDKKASDDDKLSTSRMRVRAHIYPDHSTQVNFSSHEYQTSDATDDSLITEAYRRPKPMAWETPSVFTNGGVFQERCPPT